MRREASRVGGREASVPAMAAPPIVRRNPLTRNIPALIGLVTLVAMFVACFATLGWSLGREPGSQLARYENIRPEHSRIPPAFTLFEDVFDHENLASAVPADELSRIAERHGVAVSALERVGDPGLNAAYRASPAYEDLERAWPRYLLGSDTQGRSLLARCLLGGTISLTIGFAAALVSLLIGTLYGAIAGYVGGAVDNAMMRIVDILYGLPYILLVVLLAVATDAWVEELTTRGKERQGWQTSRLAEVYEQVRGEVPDRSALDAFKDQPVAGVQREAVASAARAVFGGASARIGREGTAERAAAARLVDAGSLEASEDVPGLLTGALLSVEGLTVGDAFRTLGTVAVPEPPEEIRGLRRALNLAALVVAIGGVSWLTMARVIRGQVLSLKNQPFVEAARAVGTPTGLIFVRHLLPNLIGPIVVYATLTVPQAILQESFLSFLGIGVSEWPSWGLLAADGLDEVNRHKSHWWLIVFPSLLLAVTLLSLNFVGEGLREAFDPRRRG